MLSRFDLVPGVTAEDMAQQFTDFMKMMKAQGLVSGYLPVGKRLADTPMDTDSEIAAPFYAVTSFRDRAQLDAAYAFIENGNATDLATHDPVRKAVVDACFTCWEEI